MAVYVDLDHSRISPELFNLHPKLKQTLSLVKIGHNGQTYNNLPYWHHTVRVLLRLNWKDVDSDDVYATLLHDTIEDTPITEGDLLNFGYSYNCLNMVKAVTRNKDEETYKMFIQRIIATNDLGIMRMKLADLYENSNNVRFLPPEKRKVMIRYGKSIQDILVAMSSKVNGIRLAENILSGELDRVELEKWIGEQPRFV